MRSVPSRASRYGFTPTDAPIGERIKTLRGLSALGQNIGDRPLQKGWEQGIQSYADAVWGAVRVLQDAAATQSNVYTWRGYGPVPANAVPYDDAIARIVTELAPTLRPTVGEQPSGALGEWNDVFKKVPFLLGLKTVNWTVAQGDSAKFESARKAKDALLTRLTALRQELVTAGGTPYLTRLVKPTETVKDALVRFKAPPAAPAPAVPASTAPAAASSRRRAWASTGSTAPAIPSASAFRRAGVKAISWTSSPMTRAPCRRAWPSTACP